MAASVQAALAAGDVFAERYEVVRCIGAGGMGAVYEVIDRKTRRRRALKVMLPSALGDEEMRRRFKREGVVVAEIESEHIAEIIDCGVDEGSGAPFIALELLKGKELAELIKEGGPVPAEDVVLYLGQAASAIERAHALGVVHRDLKPENLFVTYRDDGSARIKLLDFGIAKVTSGSMSAPTTQGILGTPLYMAPEQMTGAAVTGATDVYALAHIAYTALVGEPYWRKEQRAGDGVYALLVAIMRGMQEQACARASARGVTLPTAFDEWFERATSADPTQRPRSAPELVEALARVLDVPVRTSGLIRITGAQAAPPASPGAVVTSSTGDAGGDPTAPALSSTLATTGRPARWTYAAAALAVVGLAGIGVTAYTQLGAPAPGATEGDPLEAPQPAVTVAPIASSTAALAAVAPVPSASAAPPRASATTAAAAPLSPAKVRPAPASPSVAAPPASATGPRLPPTR